MPSTMLAALPNVFIERFLPSIIVLAITIIIASFVNKTLKTKFLRIATRLKIDETQYTYFRKFIIAIIYFLGIVIAAYFIPELSALSISLFASAGVAAIIIGLAAQQTISNVLSGITLILSRPFRVGDKVKIQDEFGTIEDITLRHVVINSWENKRVIIPNAKINEATIINLTIKDPRTIKRMDFTISYDSNIDVAKKIIAEEIRNHNDFIQPKKPQDFLQGEGDLTIKVTELKESGVQITAFFWSKDSTTGSQMIFDLLESIKKKFDKESIEIPVPYRKIIFSKDFNEKKDKLMQDLQK